MKTIMVNLLFSMSCLLASSFAFSGEISGGADDFKPILAWFRHFPSEDQRIVHVCYSAADSFGVEHLALEKMISAAFQSWGNYIRDKKLSMGPSDALIVSEIDLRSACHGDEDLTFYFGSENPQVAAGESDFEHPYAFAEFTGIFNFGSQPLWGNGFIWIRNLETGWSIFQPELAGLILHEVGHVFGNQHEDGTVMTADIGAYVAADTNVHQVENIGKNLNLYSSIDSQIELVSCPTCHTSYQAAAVFDEMSDPILNPQGDWKASFQLLTGKVAVPPLSIRYERLGTSDGNGKVTVSDATGTYAFPVQIETYLSTTADSTPLFAGQAGTTFHTESSHELANIKTLTGEVLTVDLQTNIKDRKNDHETGHKVKIVVLDGKSTFPQVLFLSDDPT